MALKDEEDEELYLDLDLDLDLDVGLQIFLSAGRPAWICMSCRESYEKASYTVNVDQFVIFLGCIRRKDAAHG